MVLDPAGILAAEGAYEALLDALERRLVTAPAPSWPPAGEAAPLIERLIAARRPATQSWLAERTEAEREALDPTGGLSFWVALEACDRGEPRRAVELLAGRVPPALRGHADWLRVASLEAYDSLAAGSLAVALIHQHPRHLFAGSLVVRAARHLLAAGRDAQAQRLLDRQLPELVGEAALAAAAETYGAEIAWRAGDEGAFVAAFLRAAAAAPGEWRAGEVRRGQAIRILTSGNLLESKALRRAVEVLCELGPLRQAYTGWLRCRDRLAPDDRRGASRAILGRLYDARWDGALDAAVAWAIQLGDRGVALYGALLAGRAHRRRGELGAMIASFRQASLPGVAAGAMSGQEAREAALALWELSRELEDGARWSPAAEGYAELADRFPESGFARESRLREARCRFRAGEPEAAEARLAELCAGARADQTAGPCLWAALLGGAEETRLLAKAAGERNPGYFAFRARQALRFWEEGCRSDACTWAGWAAEARDPTSWAYPAVAAGLDPAVAGRLLGLIADQPIARRGILFLHAGRAGWARAQWRRLPGWRALSAPERAALLRGLGDQAEAVRVGIRVGDRRARYPVAFAPEIAAAAEATQLSPALLLAVIRQESLGEVGVRSPAGAVGLMQLMPATARRMADSLGWQHVDLLRPAENIMLGSRHLQELLERAAGELPVALAAYNGGWQAARRWRARAGSLDEFIERIGYGETRRFVKSVLMHYGFFHALYAPSAPPEVPVAAD